MSSFDPPQLLTLLSLATVALAATAAGLLIIRRLKSRRSIAIANERLHRRDLIPNSPDAIVFVESAPPAISVNFPVADWEVRQSTQSGLAVHQINGTAQNEGGQVAQAWNELSDISPTTQEMEASVLGAERRRSLLQAHEAWFCYENIPPVNTNLPIEEQLHQLLNARLVECNDAYAKLCMADSPAEIIGTPLFELAQRSPIASSESNDLDTLRTFIEGGYKLEDYRKNILLIDGSPLVSNFNGRGVVKDGYLTFFWGMMLDLSDREAQQLDLRRSEARFERMAQQSPALIYQLRLGDDFGLEFISDAVDSICGYPRDHKSINDAVLNELFSPDNLKLLTSELNAGKSGPVLTRHLHKAGRFVYLEHRVVPASNNEGQLVRIEGVAVDVTDRVNSQQQLQTALNEISRLKNDLQRENVGLREEILHTRGFDLIVGKSPAFERVLDLARRAAPTESTILILGETGTGKELFARSIHQSSSRSNKPKIRINCAALPQTLIESELFGHTKGAFTGAETSRMGRFEAADGGTLFLDEIAEISLDLQSKLLRVVQEGEFERVGDNKTIKVDVRLIAATNTDLAAAVERGDFRADLYYRLNVFPIVLPALRDRSDDIPILANHFAIKHSHRLGRTFDSISPEFLQLLIRHDWPGNVRELESTIERSIIVSSGGILQPVQLSARRNRTKPRHVDELAQSAEVFDRSLRDAERQYIVRMLEETDWVIEGPLGAANKLGIAPSTLRSKMKKLGIRRPGIADTTSAESTNRRIH